MELGRHDPGKVQQGDQQHPLPPHRRLKPSEMAAHGHHLQPPPPQKCPRCDSSNTKFCYYNNYSLSQPRYFCKACRRYWTHGGTLRNVPVGGGCRKSKRPKQSAASSSSVSSEISRTQPLPPSVPNSQNLAGSMISSQSLFRALPPPAMGNSFYAGGGVLSSLGALQSLPAGIISQGGTANLGSSHAYGANMTLLEGISLPPLKPASTHQFQPLNEFFPLQQSLNFPPRLPLNSQWTDQSFNGRDQTSSSTLSPNFWSSSTADGDNQAGASLSRWSDKLPGFDPSH